MVRQRVVRIGTGILAAAVFLWTAVGHTRAQHMAIPVVIIGGSAAAGWHDSTDQGYVVRALDHWKHADGLNLSIENHAIPGSRVINPHVKAHFPAWMKRSQGGVVVIAWGYLNDIRLKTKPDAIVTRVHSEIAEALATDHTVILASPPATEPTFTFDKRQEHAIWRRVAAMADTFHSTNVHVLNIMNPEIHYIKEHHQSYTRYMKGEWDPNTAGHILAARLLNHEAKKLALPQKIALHLNPWSL